MESSGGFVEVKSKLAVLCEVCLKDSSIIRYLARVKATLSRGKLTGIEEMKTKVLVWVKVTSVNVESENSDKVSDTLYNSICISILMHRECRILKSQFFKLFNFGVFILLK